MNLDKPDSSIPLEKKLISPIRYVDITRFIEIACVYISTDCLHK